MCIWEWKRQIFLTNNVGLETQFTELSLEGVRRKIQQWLDRQGRYPTENSPEEYGFYIRECFPISDDRRAFFQELNRNAQPHVGYRLLCHLAEADMLRSVWSTNFDGLPARAAANFKLAPIEIGTDTKGRIFRTPSKGELLCVSLHGDYRYDQLKNTPQELQNEDADLRNALVQQVKSTSLIVCGYSGRDRCVMETLSDAYSESGTGALYWCGFADTVPGVVTALLEHAREHGREAHYVPALGFDDVVTRIALHSLEGEGLKAAFHTLAEFAEDDRLPRKGFEVPNFDAYTVIKSNAFAIECPSEVLQFDLKDWPQRKVWAMIREKIGDRAIVAAPFKSKILAFGTIDDIQEAFSGCIKGPIERTPVSPTDFAFEDGAIVSLMRDALVRSMAETSGVGTDKRRELWRKNPQKRVSKNGIDYDIFPSALFFLRRIGGTQYLILKPSLKVLDRSGAAVPKEIANPIKLGILGYQHNKQFNQAINVWRDLIFPKGQPPVFEFPRNCGSTFKFKVLRTPAFGRIGIPHGDVRAPSPTSLQPFLKHNGFQLLEPKLVFSNRSGTGTVGNAHPIVGLVENRPYDYPLTARGLATSLRIGIICPYAEAASLQNYLHKAHQRHTPTTSERDYLIDFPGFESAYGLPIELPDPGTSGWTVCPEPSFGDPRASSREIAGHINRSIESLRSSYAPNVVLIFFPQRWDAFRSYKTDAERFNVHDFVKAFCVQRGVATQFLDQSTLADSYQCRVWWWLSLALYVKGMRTPWVLEGLSEGAAFAGLGFSIDTTAETGRHVVLGCSHIYSARGEGLQFRLSKIENPIISGENAFMSKDDARRTGETIRQLFFDARLKLPARVVLHKRTPFRLEEREGLYEGLSGVPSIEMLEIQVDHALRYVASVMRNGTIDEDNYPVRRGTAMKLDDSTALLWVHGATEAVNPRMKYFQGKRRIPAPLKIKRHAGTSSLEQIADEILGLSKMDWNNFDLYSKLPATLQSSSEIARIGSLLQRFGTASYDYRLFI